MQSRTRHSCRTLVQQQASKKEHQWEVKGTPVSLWQPTAMPTHFLCQGQKCFPKSSTGVWVSCHGWTSMNKSYEYDWECVEPESLKEQQSGFWASFILADCWTHGWGNWVLQSSGCCERNTELCIWKGGAGLLAPIPPPPLPLFPFTDR